MQHLTYDSLYHDQHGNMNDFPIDGTRYQQEKSHIYSALTLFSNNDRRAATQYSYYKTLIQWGILRLAFNSNVLSAMNHDSADCMASFYSMS